MSRVKIKNHDAIKAVNKKIKEAFSELKHSVASGKINPIKSLTGLIHCSYDEHVPFVFISALNPEGSNSAIGIEPYVRVSALSASLQEQFINEIKENFGKDVISEAKSEDLVNLVPKS